MVTTDRNEAPSVSDLLSDLEPTEEMETGGSRRRGGLRRWVVRGLTAAVILGLGAVGLAKLAGTFDTAGSGPMLTHVVQRGELLVTITEDGELESAVNVDVKCEVAGGSTILWLVDDGKEVEAGDKLAELDSSQLEEKISQQKITYEKARAAHIQAEKDFSVAKIAVKEYLEGIYRKDLQDAEALITIALENLRSAENTLQHTERMFRKGYVSPLQLEAQQFAVKRMELELEAARTSKDLLERFTKEKTLEDLQSQRDTAEARLQSEKAAFELEEGRLERLEAQLEKCVIHAPQAGMVVYGNPSGMARFMPQQLQIEEGATVRERQTIFRLPDLSQMQVKVAVHESKVDQLSRDMRARVRILDREFQGTVGSIANQPEATFVFMGNVKEYATIVRLPEMKRSKDLSEQSSRFMLKPGMTAEVEILVAHLKDVLTLPVAAVVQQRGDFFCWVRKGDQVERRPLVLGLSNDEFVEIKDGVSEGEDVVLNPRAVVAEAREEQLEPEKVDVEEKFGAPAKDAEAGSGQPRGAPRPGGPPPKTSPGGAPAAKSEISGPPGARAGPPQGAPGPTGTPRGGPPRSLMSLDKDGDGKISREELPEPARKGFDYMDTDRDGFIDAVEIAEIEKKAAEAMKRARQRGGLPGGGMGPGSGPPPEGGPR